MIFTRKNIGVCSNKTTVRMSDGIIETISVEGGCDGSLSGICSLLEGMPAKQAIEKLEGIKCDHKKTSCPEQIALCLKEALQK